MRRRFRSLLEEDALEEPLINLTPLIDVVFVVLIAFMLIAPLLEKDSVALASRGPATKKEAASSPISISVRADNTIWYQGQSILLAQLEKKLKEEKKQHPQAIPQLIQDRRAQFGTYQSLKNLLESAGFEQMDVILQPNQ
jgi:biopolymer transport protein ExbD